MQGFERDVEPVGESHSASLKVEFWFEKDGSIRMTSEADPSVRIIIKDDPERPSGHPKLFQLLATSLRIKGAQEPLSSAKG